MTKGYIYRTQDTIYSILQITLTNTRYIRQYTSLPDNFASMIIGLTGHFAEQMKKVESIISNLQYFPAVVTHQF